MISKKLILFTTRFPYKGGESFLETEIQYLKKQFSEIVIYPLQKGTEYYCDLPKGIEVRNIFTAPPVKVSKLVYKYFGILLQWYFFEFIFSKNRFKYISQFSYNFNRLIGLLNNAEQLRCNLGGDENEPLLLYSYWFNEWGTILSLCRSKGLKGRYVIRTHGYDFDEQQQGRGYFPFRYVEMQKFDRICQVSDYGQAYLKEKFPGNDKLFVNKLGVVDNGINPVGENEVYSIVTCSNSAEVKRLPLIIETLSRLKVKFFWTHFGGGNGMDEIIKFASTKLTQSDYSFKGNVANTDVLKYYRENHVDIFLNMSRLEGLPVSLMEAIATGIPVVGCNICGVPEIVNEKTGILLEANPTPENAAMAIETFLKTRARNSDFLSGIKNFWREHFNADINYPDFIKNNLN